MLRAVAAIGLCSWDKFVVVNRYPCLGEYATVLHQFEQAGGTTSNTCDALAKLDVDVSLASTVGADREGELLVQSLKEAGCDTSMIDVRADYPTDSSYILLPGGGEAPDRTILWVKGAQPRHGDKLPIERLLEHRWVLIDVNDDRLRAFLLDLPAHVSPRTQLIGAMTYLTDTDRSVGWQHLLGHEIVFGNERELMHLTAAANPGAAIATARDAMPGTACRVIYLTSGARGSTAIRPEGVTTVPAFEVDVIDTTGAGDAFAAGCIWGITDSLDDREVLARGNAVGALACRAMGARAGLPTRDEAEYMVQHGTTLTYVSTS
ncbi:sugar kinase [soil metagenome]